MIAYACHELTSLNHLKTVSTLGTNSKDALDKWHHWRNCQRFQGEPPTDKLIHFDSFQLTNGAVMRHGIHGIMHT